MTERDYVLGTHDAEIERLGLQHRVWRERAHEAWQRADIGRGQTVIDVGAGPGYAALDLADLVGASGRVIAIERSRRFLDVLEDAARRHGFANITLIEADIVERAFVDLRADAAWCRWVLSFVRDPRAAVAHIGASLRSGGVAVFHEYLDYRTWRLAPRSEAFERFVAAAIESVRRDGGLMDSALALPCDLAQAGFEIISLRPTVEVVAPSSDVWAWPASFTTIFLDRLAAAGELTPWEAEATRAALVAAAADPRSLMVTPTVLEVVARKR